MPEAPWHFWGTAVLQGIINFFYCIAYLETGVAKALMLISLHPIWSGLGGWRLLGDPLPIRTIIALVGAVSSMVLMFVPPAFDSQNNPSAISSNSAAPDGRAGGGGLPVNRDTLHGDLIALAAGFAVACNIILSRHASQVKPDAPSFSLWALASSLSAYAACCGVRTIDGFDLRDFTLITPTGMAIILSAGFLLARLPPRTARAGTTIHIVC